MGYTVKQEGKLSDTFPYHIYDDRSIVALVSNLEDANRMVSAPDLYEALKEVRDNAVLQKQANGYYLLRLSYSSWKEVCGAIAKAESK